MAKQQSISKPAAVLTVAEAEQTVARLQETQRQVAAERAAAENETGRYAFDAHARGDMRAVAELDKIADIIMRHDQRLREINLALSEAAARLQEARAVEASAQGRGVARELLKRSARLVELAQTLDDANRIRVDASCALADELEQARSLAHGVGLYVPSHQQLLAMGSRAERTSMALMPWAREVGEAIAPNERRNHVSYVQHWRDAIAKGCAALMGDANHKQEAA